MKNLFTAIVFLLVSNFAFGQIEWAPQGAMWHYTVVWEDFFGQMTEVIPVHVLGDTTIQGQQCRVLAGDNENFGFGWGCHTNDGREFMYEAGGKVYFFDENSLSFGLLYDFSKNAGESWLVPLCEQLGWEFDTLRVTVDSVTYPIISGQPLKYQHVHLESQDSSWGFGNDIIAQGIGSLTKMFLIRDATTAHVWITELRCYESPATGVIKFIEQPCGFISPTTEATKNQYFTIAPNPTAGPATLTFTLPPGISASVQIFNSYGQLVQKHSLQQSTSTFQLDDLQPGLYFVVLESEGRPIKTKKLLRF